MSLTAIIVDDEPLARQELQYLLAELGGVEVVAQGANGIEAVQLIQKHQPALVFLDVQMPGLDGFGVIKKLLEKKVELPQVVFATAFDHYAVKAFEVNAADYLLKPFDKKRLAKTVERAAARVIVPDGTASGAKLDALLRLVEEQAQPVKSPSSKIVVRAQNRLMLVHQSEICYAGIDEGAITVVTATIEGQSNCRTLEELMEQLNPEIFWRAHRSFIVSLQHIREVVPWFNSSYQLRMDDRKQTEVPVSRSQTKRLRELFNL